MATGDATTSALATASGVAPTTGANSSIGGRKKVLIILSSADHIDIKKPDGSEVQHKTGFFLKELAAPLRKILEAGYEPVFANPKGTEPQMDPMSDSAMWYPMSPSTFNEDRKLLEEMSETKGFKTPLKFADVKDDLLEQCAGVFVPGGHAPMQDLGNDSELGRILEHFHAELKPTAVICHGPIALLSTLPANTLHNKATDPDGPGLFPYREYKISCYSNREEKANEWMWWGNMQKTCEDALRENSIEVQISPVPLASKVVVDREVVSAENPTSAPKLGETFVEMLQKVDRGERLVERP